VLSRLPETKRAFTKADGAFYSPGDRFHQPELAATPRQVAERGAGVMCTGDWARRIVDAVSRDGGKITLRDLETYRVAWEAPIETTFGGPGSSRPGPRPRVESTRSRRSTCWSSPA